MALEIHIYRGDDSGGPVDYAAPTATVPLSAGSFAVPDLAPGQSRRYAIRTHDPATGLEEKNTDARVTIARDAAGVDVSRRPGAPTGLAATPGPGGTATIRWTYLGSPAYPDPSQFAIYISNGPIDYATPAATVPFAPRTLHFSHAASGLAGGTTYTVAVRGVLGPADDGNTTTATFAASDAGPASAVGLAGVSVYQERGT